jgi:hypothetical protein
MHRKSRARVWRRWNNLLVSNAWLDFWSPERSRRRRRGMVLLYGSTEIPKIAECFQLIALHVFAMRAKPERK